MDIIGTFILYRFKIVNRNEENINNCITAAVFVLSSDYNGNFNFRENTNRRVTITKVTAED